LPAPATACSPAETQVTDERHTPGYPASSGDCSTPAADLRDALEAVREALAIPHAATVGDDEIRAKILEQRLGHVVVMLGSVLDDDRAGHPQLTEMILADRGSFWWSWAERITGVANTGGAADAVARVLAARE
jgi:hypothetical protein